MSRHENVASLKQLVRANEKTLKKIQETEKILDEAEKRKLASEEIAKKQTLINMKDRYCGSTQVHFDAALGQATRGFQTADEFKAKSEEIAKQFEKEEKTEPSEPPPSQKRVANKSKLSFQVNDDDDYDSEDEGREESDDEENSLEAEATDKSSKKIRRDPTVDTTFIDSKETEKAIEEKKRQLIEEYLALEEEKKKAKLEITYSYWDGQGHRKQIDIQCGDTVGFFLEAVRKQLSSEFSELRVTNTEQMLFIKEDIILPHNKSFYELMKERACNKHGNVFEFNVVNDIRIMNNVQIANRDSHAGKVVLLKWYQRNKKAFPACQWEKYDISKHTLKE